MNTLVGLIIAHTIVAASGLPGPQIIGGVDARDGMYLYQVSVRYNDKHLCSGAIISEKYIVTVARCVYGYETPYKFSVAVGSNDLNNLNVVHRVKAVRVHAGYNKSLRIHDIALIRLSTDIEFNENVQAIALPIVDNNYEKYPFVITGWNANEMESFPNKLQEIIVKGYSQDKCKNHHAMIKESQMCITTRMNGEAVTDEDLGDPVVADNVLVGLVSYATDSYEYANVCTRIFYYRSWINHYADI